MPDRPDRAHDLPPLWDGRAVQWSQWTDQDAYSTYGILRFHAPADHWACTGCGWIRDRELRAVGTLMPASVAETAWPVVRLVVRRCPGCHLDEVTDLHTGEVWDLQDADYTDAGSWPDTVPVQGTLF
jgi:hypothetical protein